VSLVPRFGQLANSFDWIALQRDGGHVGPFFEMAGAERLCPVPAMKGKCREQGDLVHVLLARRTARFEKSRILQAARFASSAFCKQRVLQGPR
jgi:hypothetical protein